MGDADAIAIGGGLAGAAFALELARNGARAVVLERSRAATLRVCGDFLSAEALELLAYLGIDTAALGATQVERLTLASGARTATAALPFRAAGLSRLALDEALLAAAAGAGAEVFRGVSVGGMSAGQGRVTLDTDGGPFAARGVALASGKHNRRGWPRAPGAVSGFKIQLQLSPAATAALAGRVHLTLFDGGYAGLTLVEGGLATLCWQIDTGALKRTGAGWREQSAAIAQTSPPFGDLIADAVPASERAATIANLPFGYVRRAPVAPGVFPVGDQMAVIPAFTGDGTSIALASGIAAARAVLAGRPAADYQRQFAGSLSRQFALARAVNAALRASATRRLTVGAVGLVPALATMLARATRLTAVARPVLAG
jgi:flavin-dependent dehydrogenase